MTNQEIAAIFYEMADLCEILSIQWTPNAYRKAARFIETLSKPIDEIYNKGGTKALQELPSIGKNIANKIEEFIKKGKVKELDELKKKIPKGVDTLLHVPGLGPKKAWRLYKELNIKNLRDLQRAAESHKISKLEGFGEKSETEILQSIDLVQEGETRKLLIYGLAAAREIEHRLKGIPGVQQVQFAGSVRRRKETIADIDILVTSKNPKQVMSYFTTMQDVKKILANGPTKSAVLLNSGMQADVRVVDEKSFGAALQYFTGSKEHNVRLRQIAINKGLKLNEYGLFKGATIVAGKTEQDIYKKLGLPFIEPELRENNGEFEAKQLPNLINYDDMRGDCHMHTTASDGANTAEEMVKAAIAKGYEYVAITDHSKSSYIANGLDEKRLHKHHAALDALQKKYGDITILKGSEVDIKSNGELDYSPAILKDIDVVMASVHQRFKMTRDEATKRYLKAISLGHITCISHPSGRLIHEREAFEF
ncbi:MAG: DNA polymerase/3'-5' exonuclease PolX, partial [Nanoarchaeota archaeon]